MRHLPRRLAAGSDNPTHSWLDACRDLVENRNTMTHNLIAFAIQWTLLTFLLWIASHVFKGIRYTSPGALWVAALLLGFANAVVRPILVCSPCRSRSSPWGSFYW